MKKIKKFWGIGLILVLLATMVFSTAPVQAANPLNWEPILSAPASIPFNVLAPGIDIVDFDMNGSVAYAVTGAALYQSTSGGAMWSNITPRLALAGADYVAIAPDDTDVIVVADATPAAGVGVQISINGGVSFTSMGTIEGLVGDPVTAINGIAISPTIAGGVRYIAVYGAHGAGASTELGAIYYYNYGAGVGIWQDAVEDFTGVVNANPSAITALGTLDSVDAFAFSPIFQADFMAVAVMTDATSDVIELHSLSFNANGNWDTETGYPAAVYTGAGALTVNDVSLVLAPEYDGSDETSRISFIGMDATDGGAAAFGGGVWRAMDYAVGQVYGNTIASPISSVTYDGTSLAAGSATSNNVVRCLNPLGATMTFQSARAYKRIGADDGADNVVVKFNDGVLYGGKSGLGAAFSKSTDNGNTWNDFSLIDDGYEAANTVFDLYTAADGTMYLATDDAATTSVYRIAAGATSRVLCIPSGSVLIFGGVASDSNVIYAADKGGSDIYYSADGGTGRWYKRTAPATIADIAVDTASSIFVGDSTSVDIYKSSNSGFTWSAALDTKLFAAVVDMYALGDGQVIASDAAGFVAVTSNGGDTWVAKPGAPANALITASGLGDGQFLFAADPASSNVWRYAMGAAETFAWQTMNAPLNDTEVNTGIYYLDGVLFTVSDQIVVVGPPAVAATTYLNRSTMPNIAGTHAGIWWGTQYADATVATLNALQAQAADGVVTLRAFDNTAGSFWYFEDTLVKAAPVVTAPANESIIQLTSAMLGASQPVNFSWNRLSQATSYTQMIALDPAFTSIIKVNAVISSAPVVAFQELGTTFTPGTTYYWMVSATTPLSSSGSEVRSFTIQQVAASVPQIGSPVVGAVIDSQSPAFSWSPIAGATAYKFELSTNAAFATTVYADEIYTAGAQLPITIELEQGKQYFWRVKALTPNEGDWSTVGNFVVAAEETPTSTAPAITITTQPAPTFTIPVPDQTTITVVPPAEGDEIAPAYIWAIIVIGAILVIAMIVLIVRTRRSV